MVLGLLAVKQVSVEDNGIDLLVLDAVERLFEQLPKLLLPNVLFVDVS